MASRYESLQPGEELERVVAADLAAALQPRGCIVTCRRSRMAQAGSGDIRIFDSAGRRLLLVAVTRRKGAATDELRAAADHLDEAVAAGGHEDCGCLYLSPATPPRLALEVVRHNRLRERAGKRGRIIALDLGTLDQAVQRWRGAGAARYPAARLGGLLAGWEEAADDHRARTLVARALFGEDEAFLRGAEGLLRQHDTATEQALRKGMERLEDRLRDRGVTGAHANETLVYLAFLRLHEEKRQRERGEDNRFTREGFARWCAAQGEEVRAAHPRRLVQHLLEVVAADPALEAAGLLRAQGHTGELHPSVDDGLVIAEVLDLFDRFAFSSSSLDVLGVVFETLARRGEKDTRVGQFFTPQEVVRFCAQLVRLEPSDVVLDPAVGTGRFLIAARSLMRTATGPGTGRERGGRPQLLGADLDGWIVTIARMNVFLRGEGDAIVAQANGLALRDRAAFGHTFADGVGGRVDVVLTNPPLGDTSYLVACDMWKEGAGRPVGAEEVEGFLRSLGVVSLADAPRPARRRACREGLTGARMKGGALFLGAVASYLKADRSPADLLEWQGGRCAIVLDEAILNAPEHAPVRRFIRHAFFVKAVVSLGRPAFRYLAHTDAKTSILYLVKKPRRGLRQQEPVFFAHAERVGYSSTGKWIGSDLPAVGQWYEAFERTVRAATRARFDAALCAVGTGRLPGAGDAWHGRALPADEGGRLDFFGARHHDLVRQLEEDGIGLTTLGALMTPRAPTPPVPAADDAYDFASIDRNLGTIARKGRQAVSYRPEELWCLEEGDVVVSGIDLVHGAIAVAGAEVAGLVMSKEMFPYRATAEILPEYLVLLLRAGRARTLIHGRVTGTSNRTRITSPEQILDLPVPRPPTLREQAVLVRGLLRARRRCAESLRHIERLASAVAAAWGAPVATTPLLLLPEVKETGAA